LHAEVDEPEAQPLEVLELVSLLGQLAHLQAPGGQVQEPLHLVRQHLSVSMPSSAKEEGEGHDQLDGHTCTSRSCRHKHSQTWPCWGSWRICSHQEDKCKNRRNC
jgi:hypothetical protein